MMKRLFLALTLFGLLFSLVPQSRADGEVSINFFYDNLEGQGSWIDVADYGYCFQPSIAANDVNWRPYTDGYWAYTDAGWTWVSYEDFGWATYHYGRWAWLSDYGWLWVPGYEWGPAWVSWRTGGDYVGWAPLPPGGERVYEGHPISGHVDVAFDIGPAYYNFVDIHYIGEPVLRGHIFEPTRNVTIINQTVNITNITYNNSVVYNQGPDIAVVSRYSSRPIQRMVLQRETNVNSQVASRSGGRNLNRVNGNQLVVVAPKIRQEKVAPPRVKARVNQPKIEHGWQGVADRTHIQEQMKNENARNVPPPTSKPGANGTGPSDNVGQNPGAAAAARPAGTQTSHETRPVKGAAQSTGEHAIPSGGQSSDNVQNQRERPRQMAPRDQVETKQNNASQARERSVKHDAPATGARATEPLNQNESQLQQGRHSNPPDGEREQKRAGASRDKVTQEPGEAAASADETETLRHRGAQPDHTNTDESRNDRGKHPQHRSDESGENANAQRERAQGPRDTAPSPRHTAEPPQAHYRAEQLQRSTSDYPGSGETSPQQGRARKKKQANGPSPTP